MHFMQTSYLTNYYYDYYHYCTRSKTYSYYFTLTRGSA